MESLAEELSRLAQMLLDIPVRGSERRALMLEIARRMHNVAKELK